MDGTKKLGRQRSSSRQLVYTMVQIHYHRGSPYCPHLTRGMNGVHGVHKGDMGYRGWSHSPFFSMWMNWVHAVKKGGFCGFLNDT